MYSPEVYLSFCNYMNEKLDILEVQVNGPLPKRLVVEVEQTGVTAGEKPWQSENRYHILEVTIYLPKRNRLMGNKPFCQSVQSEARMNSKYKLMMNMVIFF